MPSRLLKHQGKELELNYLSVGDVACREGGDLGRFQELELLDYIQEQSLRGVFMDCGANIGNHSVYFMCRCMSTLTVSIEAHPTIFKMLEHNMDLNSDGQPYVCVNAALWSEDKDHVFMGPVVKGNAGRTKVYTGGDRWAPRKDVKVACRTIDDIWRKETGSDQVVVLKLDIEDSEVPAIKGATGLLRRDKPLIVAEHHSQDLCDEFAAVVEPFGYRLYEERFAPRGETAVWLPSWL